MEMQFEHVNFLWAFLEMQLDSANEAYRIRVPCLEVYWATSNKLVLLVFCQFLTKLKMCHDFFFKSSSTVETLQNQLPRTESVFHHHFYPVTDKSKFMYI